jgi:TPP-dependent 2-oxoacid decarboxylase
MKHQNSQSLLASIKKDSEFRIFFSKDGQLFSVILNNDGLTIETAISESISKFNS